MMREEEDGGPRKPKEVPGGTRRPGKPQEATEGSRRPQFDDEHYDEVSGERQGSR